MKIKTNSQLPEEPKSTAECTVFSLYQHFANPSEIEALSKRYQSGIGWGEAKQILFEKMDATLTPFREKYESLMADPSIIDAHLEKGRDKARLHAQTLLKKVKQQIGMIV